MDIPSGLECGCYGCVQCAIWSCLFDTRLESEGCDGGLGAHPDDIVDFDVIGKDGLLS